MDRVLVVDDDPGTLEGFDAVLRDAGFGVQTANCGRAALCVLKSPSVEVVLADLNLPDVSGLELLREVRRTLPSLAFVIVTGFGSTASAVEAMHLGVSDYVEKPLIGDELIQVVSKALSQYDAAVPTSIEAHAAARWARAIVAVVTSESDPRTIEMWSKCAGISQGAIKTWCHVAGLQAKDSLDFARLLRALLRLRSHHHPIEQSLDIVDSRTLKSLLQRCGVKSGNPSDCPTHIDRFIDSQSLIRDRYALAELRKKMRQ